jgi:glycolate oxidase
MIPSPGLERPSPTALARVRRALLDAVGGEAVIDDPERFGPYSEDASFGGVHPPDLVVRAGSVEDVQAVLRLASEHRVPVTPRGLGTGKSGGALPICGGIVLSLERLSRVREIDREDMVAVAEPGIVTADFMAAVESEGLFYPPDPNSLKMCSLGGNVACNAGGPRALKYGVTRGYVLGVEVVLATGARHRFGHRTIKGVTGYDLCGLIVGSEGTLGVITEITTKLVPLPAAVQTALVSFPDVLSAGRGITRALGTGVIPRTLELLDDKALDALRAKHPGRYPDSAGALLILETDGTSEDRAMEDLERTATACLDEGALDVQVALDAAQRERVWEPRRMLSWTLAETAPKKMSEDIVVPRSRIPRMLEAVARISDETRIRMATYGHAGDGNLHVNVLYDEASADRAQLAVRRVMEATVELGGTISGEHGIGLTKRDFLGIEQPEPLIALQRALKAQLDPAGILNPGKIFPLGGVRE